jgi:hypothetical protein
MACSLCSVRLKAKNTPEHMPEFRVKNIDGQSMNLNSMHISKCALRLMEVQANLDTLF